MARKRDYRSEYVRREEIARIKGYKSYYDYRLHRHGRIPASVPPPSGRRKERLAGRRGIGQLFAQMENQEVEMFHLNVSKFGQDPHFDLQAVLTDGTTVEYKLRGRAEAKRFFDTYEAFPEADRPELIVSPRAMASLMEAINA